MFLKILSRRPVPLWLSKLDVSSLKSVELPLKELLKDSLYYPACRFDGRSIQFLGGFVHSFIYVDYGVEEDEVIQEFRYDGFLGYELVGEKELMLSEIFSGDCELQLPSQYAHEINRYNFQSRWRKKPFARWMIFSRQENYSEGHGPSRFSVLYICADGVATYKNLYCHNNLAPEIIAIISPGTGLGGNWTDFRSQSGYFAWMVLNKCKRLPRYMLAGGYLLNYFESFWPQFYSIHVEWLQHIHGNGVWMIDQKYRKFARRRTRNNGSCGVD